jgi:hypothetical protein
MQERERSRRGERWRDVLPVSSVDIQQLARSGATAVHIFLAWCRSKGIKLAKSGQILEDKELDVLVATWGQETFGANSPLLEMAKSVETIVSEKEVIDTEIIGGPPPAALDRVASDALQRAVVPPPPAALAKSPPGQLVATLVDPGAQSIAVRVEPAAPPPATGRPCPICRGEGTVPKMMMGRMVAASCETCGGTGLAPKPKQRGTACSCTARAISPMCVAHGLECICPTPSVQHPQCPLHGRRP